MKTALALITTLVLAAQLHAKPLKVFILAGQSNMQGQAEIGTFDYHYLGCAKTFAEATLQLHK